MSMFLRKDLFMKILLRFLVVRKRRNSNEGIQSGLSYGFSGCFPFSVGEKIIGQRSERDTSGTDQHMAVRQATDASIAFFLIALCTLAFETGAA